MVGGNEGVRRRAAQIGEGERERERELWERGRENRFARLKGRRCVGFPRPVARVNEERWSQEGEEEDLRRGRNQRRR